MLDKIKAVFTTKKNKPGETGPASAFGASDNIKYRKYRNRMSTRNKSQALSKEQWKKTGMPEG